MLVMGSGTEAWRVAGLVSAFPFRDELQPVSTLGGASLPGQAAQGLQSRFEARAAPGGAQGWFWTGRQVWGVMTAPGRLPRV